MLYFVSWDMPPDAAMVNFVFGGCVQIGNYAAHSEKFIGDRYGFPIDCVEAYMVIPEVGDPPTDPPADAGGKDGAE